MGTYGGTLDRHAQNKRIRRARTQPAPVSVRHACPHCGRDHPAAEHDLTSENRAALARMSPERLRYLRGQVVDEIVIAIKRGADAAVLHDFGVVLCAIDRRLDG